MNEMNAPSDNVSAFQVACHALYDKRVIGAEPIDRRYVQYVNNCACRG